ncbi:MAG: queuosine precursor transporter, partial [Halobacteria archaeon]|nr:queuosine precursor transporter [Halobacteria archaeon]
GRRPAQVLVNVGFFMNFVMLALVWSTIAAPASQTSVDPDTFAAVLGQGTNIVIASLLAYIVSQNWDVFAFHKIKEYTNGEYLWLRNIGSTATSQAIDTVIFVTVGFYVAPQILGGFLISSPTAILSLIIGQYILKLLIAFVDTPFVYVVVGYIRSYQEDKVRTEVA